MSIKFISDSIEQIPEIAKEILKHSFPFKKLLFYGDMGLGKTTLIKELSLQLGVTDIVSSPTFSIINEYVSLNNGILYHFDFYRLKHEEEAYDMGCEEYLNGENYCFIEWPENIPSLIDDNMLVIKMRLDGIKRVIEIIK